MTEIFGEYTAMLMRVTEHFLSQSGISLDGFRSRNLRFGSSTSSSDSSSFLVYF